MFADLINGGFLKGLARCTRGAVAPMVALMLVPILGATALAVDVGYWYYKQRDMQSAADSAAIAGARTPDEDPAVDPTNDNFINVAKGTAAKYGYVDGDGTVTVDVSRVTCPSGEEGCTQVIIGYTSPLFFSPVVGFSGNKNGGSGQGVSALAVAGDSVGGNAVHNFCVVTLDNSKWEDGFVDGVTINGGSKIDFGGCDIFSNSNIRCNGEDNSLNIGTAIGVGWVGSGYDGDPECGKVDLERADVLLDPYKDLADNIPADPCGDTYAAKTIKHNDAAWNGSTVKLCGDITLGDDINVNGKTIVIYNGRLIANNKTFTATDSTVVFAGNNGSSYHFLTDTLSGNAKDSTFNISSPTTTGPWKGVAVYTDPDLTQGVDMVAKGNAPALNISGLFYTPNSDSVISGIVNKSGDGYDCFVLVTNRLTVSGTGKLFASQSECEKQGLEMPTDGNGATVQTWLLK